MEQNNQESTTSVIKNNKNILVLGIAIIIIIGIVSLLPKQANNVATKGTDEVVAFEDGCTETTAFSTSTGKPCSSYLVTGATAASAINATKTPKVSQSTSQSYEAALGAYAGKIVRITDTCTIAPATASFKTGTRILFDNASAQTIALTFQEKTVSLRPYHYSTIALKTPGTFPVGCNTLTSAATITVE